MSRSIRILVLVAPILAVFAILFLSGCTTTGEGGGKVPSGEIVNPIGDAGAKQDQAQAGADKAQKERLGMAAANVTTILKENAKTVPTPQRDSIEVEGGLALKAIGEQPDPAELVAGAERARLIAEGKAVEARAQAEDSARRAEGLSAAEAQARAELEVARTQRDNAIAQAKADLQAAAQASAKANADLQATHKREIDALNRKIEAQEMGFISKIIGGIGGICLLGAIGVAVASFQNPLGWTFKNVSIVGLLVVSSIGCFGIIRFLAHPWIPYAVGGSVLAVVLACAVLWWLSWKDTRRAVVAVEEERTSLEGQHETLTQTAAFIVDQVEKLAKDSPEAAKKITTQLDGLMDEKHKELVAWLKTKRPSKSKAVQ
jgi:hypothetical protein